MPRLRPHVEGDDAMKTRELARLLWHGQTRVIGEGEQQDRVSIDGIQHRVEPPGIFYLISIKCHDGARISVNIRRHIVESAPVDSTVSSSCASVGRDHPDGPSEREQVEELESLARHTSSMARFLS